MPIVVGVCFKKVGKIYYFDPAGLDLQEGDFVIADTTRGIELGQVMTEIREVPEEEIVPPLRQIIRKATPEDFEREESNRQKEEQAFRVCVEKIQKHNLPMKLIEADYSFDGSQVTFYFAAETRVDFRELVKDLASTLRTKVQLHQVGVRDEAKFFGGLGMCGRALCCATFLKDFEPVSMKMAKEQSLFLNPIKFSGICGKLMCCLKFEYPIYKEAKSRLPAVGSTVITPRGPGKVIEVNIIKEMLTIDLGEGIVAHYHASEVEEDKSLSQKESSSNEGSRMDEQAVAEQSTHAMQMTCNENNFEQSTECEKCKLRLVNEQLKGLSEETGMQKECYGLNDADL
ncbi:MAG: stage 0 sporulation family protein [Armatimonadota bacterium]|nr:stage 0 sporulation family protein [Armatimonadota bacterium]